MASYQGFAEIGLALNHDPKKIANYRRELDLRTGLYNVTYTYEGTTYKREAFCSHPHGLLAVRLANCRFSGLSVSQMRNGTSAITAKSGGNPKWR